MLKDPDNITHKFSIVPVDDWKVVDEKKQWPFAIKSQHSFIEPPGVMNLPDMTEKLSYLQSHVFVSAPSTPEVDISMFQRWKSNDSNKNTEGNVYVALQTKISDADENHYVSDAPKFTTAFEKLEDAHEIALTKHKSAPPSIWSEIPRIFYICIVAGRILSKENDQKIQTGFSANKKHTDCNAFFISDSTEIGKVYSPTLMQLDHFSPIKERKKQHKE